MKKVLLIGSSIFEHWTTAANAFPRCELVNRAVGGTTTDYWVPRVEPVLQECKPAMLGYYCGSNDLNQPVDPAVIIENTLKVLRISRDLGVPFVYFNIIKAPQKRGKYEIVDEINATIASHVDSGAHVVDLNSILFEESNDVSSLYIEDDLHLTPEAYSQMEALVREAYWPSFAGLLGS